MITGKLIGRLGNHLFIISAIIAYAKRHGMPYWIPKTTIDPRVWPSYFSHFPGQPTYPYSYIDYREPNFSYNEIPDHKHIRVEGYFQSEKYFMDQRNAILEAFQFPWEMQVGFVSLHVRRGDYLQFSDKHPPITLEYITQAIDHFVDLGYNSFVVCSDDISWCRDNFKAFEESGIVFSYSEGQDPIPDLVLMSCCEHNIIANSSFSWWAAWLNQNPDKIVIAPKKWFGSGNDHLDTHHLIPDNWIRF